MGQLHYFAHEYDQAIDYCKRAVALDSNFEMAHMYLADIYYLKGMDYELGEEWVKVQSRKIRPDQLEEARANVRRLGWRTVLRQAIQSLIDIEKAHPGVLSYQIARAYVKLGDKEAALHWLEQAVDQKLFSDTVCESRSRLRPLARPSSFSERCAAHGSLIQRATGHWERDMTAGLVTACQLSFFVLRFVTLGVESGSELAMEF